jgi:pimeloyl-ACP methyl ester carboxylesterase
MDYVPDVAAFLRDVVESPAALIGHSLGGHIGLVLASRHPDLVSGLVVGDAPPVSGHLVPPHASAVRASLALFHELIRSQASADTITARLRTRPGDDATRPVGAGESWVAQRVEGLVHTDPQVLETILDGTVMNEGYDADTILREIACPTLLLQSDPAHGGLTTAEEIACARVLLKTSSHLFLAGVSHNWLAKPSQRAIGAIRAFLRRDVSSAPSSDLF